MHLILLLSSLLLLGTSLANGHDTDPEGQLLNSVAAAVERLEKKIEEVENAFLTVHRARSFASGSERLYVTNKEVGNFAALGNICARAGGRIPSPQLQNENKAFASVLERHNKGAYLVVRDSAKFTNWAAGEPNTAGRTKECVVADTQGAWRSGSCEEDLLVVCEFSFI
ncbi:PLIalpha-like protein [Notechis scutatus]|uniref:PLIalpha-like protein n=1 Tax=Notechis scutatus TaxID=8663 RepID=A0A6J1UUX4_9SAUR|nr:PLIalpha-like protein [Notechis scutatus]